MCFVDDSCFRWKYWCITWFQSTDGYYEIKRTEIVVFIRFVSGTWSCLNIWYFIMMNFIAYRIKFRFEMKKHLFMTILSLWKCDSLRVPFVGTYYWMSRNTLNFSVHSLTLYSVVLVNPNVLMNVDTVHFPNIWSNVWFLNVFIRIIHIALTTHQQYVLSSHPSIYSTVSYVSLLWCLIPVEYSVKWLFSTTFTCRTIEYNNRCYFSQINGCLFWYEYIATVLVAPHFFWKILYFCGILSVVSHQTLMVLVALCQSSW